MKMGATDKMEIEAIPAGSLGLDMALGVGGLPRGRVVEIRGPKSSGKTTLALQVVTAAQKLGGTCAFIDAEHGLDSVCARKLGVDVDNLLISQPDAGEQALDICDTLVPKAELEGEMGDSHIGLHARLMSLVPGRSRDAPSSSLLLPHPRKLPNPPPEKAIRVFRQRFCG